MGSHAIPDVAHFAAGQTQSPASTRKVSQRGSAVTASAASEKLVQAMDLVYRGAFRLPQGPIAGSSFDFGGTALAFNPVHGSLFIVGHAWQQQVAEITVPAIRLATGTSDLAVAAVLQPFADIAEGRMRLVGSNPQSDTQMVGGLLPYNGKLYESVYLYYDAAGAQQLSHFVSGLDFSVHGDVNGPYRVGKLGAGFVSGYFALIPDEWQAALGGPVLNGQCCIPIISRTSFGPAAFAIDPAQLGVKDPLPAVPLVYYPSDHPTLGAWGATGTLFNGVTQMGGVVFPNGTRSVLFFGRQGLGKFCYGESTSDPALDGKLFPGSTTDYYCYDPTSGSKGNHAYPYAYYVWAYDAVDLAAVKSGQRQPWDIKPYATWSLDLSPFGVPGAIINGVAYDPKTGWIFVSQDHGDGSYPLIQVFTIRM